MKHTKPTNVHLYFNDSFLVDTHKNSFLLGVFDGLVKIAERDSNKIHFYPINRIKDIVQEFEK